MGAISDIVNVVFPSTVSTGEIFEINISVKNIGNTSDLIFVKLYDTTGGGSVLIWELEDMVDPNDTDTYPIFFPDGILATTSFHIDAGHYGGGCGDYTDEVTCTSNGCYWYDGACHSTPENEICIWVTHRGGATGLAITSVFEFIDCYLFQMPPIDYSFIPTIMQTMGIIDYYLGFITSGNTNTGCSF